MSEKWGEQLFEAVELQRIERVKKIITTHNGDPRVLNWKDADVGCTVYNIVNLQTT